MFGYATDETEECMPLTVVLAHRLNQKIAELRRSGDFWWARPDSKTQVGVMKLMCAMNCNYFCINRSHANTDSIMALAFHKESTRS